MENTATTTNNLPLTTIKKGYKLTEIGVIPEEWEVVELGEIGFFSKGKGIRKDESKSGNIPCVRYGELYTRHNDYVKKFYSHISEEVAETAKRLKTGDILFAGSGETKAEIGKSVAFTKNITAYAGGDIVILSPKSNNALFLGFLLNDVSIQKQKASRGQGDAVVHISATQLAQIQIPLPPLPEQTAIATVLSDTDNLLQALEKKIAKKRLIKQGAMQELLVVSDKGLVVRNDKLTTNNSPLTTMKEGWVVKPLGDFLVYEQPTKYIVESTKYNANYNTPVLTAGKSFILGFTNETKGIFKNYPVIIFDDFTTATKFVDFPFKVKSSAMKILKPKNEDVNLRLIYEIMQQIDFPLGDHKRHWIGEFQQLEIQVPSTKEEQTEIATILSDMNVEIESLEKKFAKYKQVKQGLMQNLLTGKIRLV